MLRKRLGFRTRDMDGTTRGRASSKAGKWGPDLQGKACKCPLPPQEALPSTRKPVSKTGDETGYNVHFFGAYNPIPSHDSNYILHLKLGENWQPLMDFQIKPSWEFQKECEFLHFFLILTVTYSLWSVSPMSSSVATQLGTTWSNSIIFEFYKLKRKR